MMNKKRIFIVAGVLVILSAIGSGGYLFWNVHEENLILRSELSGMNESLKLTKENFFRSRIENADLSDRNKNLSQTVREQLDKNTALETQVMDISGVVQNISGTVGTLQKLSQTDKELLKKYSKVYFLSENYIPSRLVDIKSEFLLDKSAPKQIHAGVDVFLTDMLQEASSTGISLKIVSAYRSFYDQISVKTGYKMIYGSGANQFSADQGYSEHQLGTTVDITTSKLKTLTTQFDRDIAYKWLTENAYRFGFVLSYPKGNSYYQYEPWHWRFVGVGLATRLHEEGKYFYDLTQREIDDYLVSIFDR